MIVVECVLFFSREQSLVTTTPPSPPPPPQGHSYPHHHHHHHLYHHHRHYFRRPPPLLAITAISLPCSPPLRWLPSLLIRHILHFVRFLLSRPNRLFVSGASPTWRARCSTPHSHTLTHTHIHTPPARNNPAKSIPLRISLHVFSSGFRAV